VELVAMAISVHEINQHPQSALGTGVAGGQNAGAFKAIMRSDVVMKRLNERLVECIKKGDIPNAFQAITQGADVNARDSASRTVLMLAVINDQTELAKFLVDCGANVNAADEYGQTPLMWAAMRGNADLVEYFINKGANVHAKDIHGNDALMLSVYGNKKTAKILVNAGAKSKKSNYYGKSALDLARLMNKAEIAMLL